MQKNQGACVHNFKAVMISYDYTNLYIYSSYEIASLKH